MDALVLNIDKEEKDEHKTPILPPLKGPCRKQIQGDAKDSKDTKLIMQEKSKSVQQQIK